LLYEGATLWDTVPVQGIDLAAFRADRRIGRYHLITGFASIEHPGMKYHSMWKGLLFENTGYIC
jgi:hypothetical protein